MASIKHKALFAFIVLQTLGAALVIASFYFWLWPLELLVSFTSFLTVLLLISLTSSSILVIILKQYKANWPLLVITSIAWAASLFIVIFSLNAQQPIKIIESNNAQITFATFNKHYDNRDDDRYIEYFKQQNVDILALQEVQADEVAYVAKQLGFEYSYVSRTFATSGGTSVAIVSRYPFESAETIELETKHPVARVTVQTPEGDNVAVYSVHIPVPSSNFLYNKRNIVLDSLAKTLNEDEQQVIVGGDFNTTFYSPAMRTFKSATNASLQATAKDKISACSWYGYGSSLCVRIDHVFTSRGMGIVDFSVAPDLGSDHRALVTTINLDQ